jgi:UDP-N-acetylmuramoylalanine--D-glutamate ligase
MDYSGMKVVVMGLGLHGGGLESARWLLRRGAELTVTDLRDEDTLAPSLEALETFRRESGCAVIRYVLGRHELADFENADMVVKNPGVRPDSPFLQAARRIETDISLFLNYCPARINAVTGSKGKSTTVSAVHYALDISHNRQRSGSAYLGGNITVSPLTFLDDLTAADDVTLELSSWQLGDIKGRVKADGGALLKPRSAALTAIMPDHLDRYGTMNAYIADKRIIYQGQDENDFTIASDDDWGRSFLAESRGRPLVYADAPLPADVNGGWFTGVGSPGFARFNTAGEIFELVPAALQIPGYHQKKNLLAAGLSLLGLGLDPALVREAFETFPGVEHRLEKFCTARGVECYNDSAATIPEAAAAAIEALGDKPLVLVTGGTDKNLDFTPLARAALRAKAVILLAGSGSEKLRLLLDAGGVSYRGPFDSLDSAAQAGVEAAAPGDRVALSPGCASFGMFRNEFDRGAKWKETIRRLV